MTSDPALLSFVLIELRSDYLGPDARRMKDENDALQRKYEAEYAAFLVANVQDLEVIG